MGFRRITIDHATMAGVPCIRGTRIPVTSIVALVAGRMTTEQIVADYPQLTADDIEEALRYAAAVDQGTLPLLEPA